MEYFRGDNFPFDFYPIGTPFGSKSKGKLAPNAILFDSKSEAKLSIPFGSKAKGKLPITTVNYNFPFDLILSKILLHDESIVKV